jgi:hypothetical protein
MLKKTTFLISALCMLILANVLMMSYASPAFRPTAEGFASLVSQKSISTVPPPPPPSGPLTALSCEELTTKGQIAYNDLKEKCNLKHLPATPNINEQINPGSNDPKCAAAKARWSVFRMVFRNKCVGKSGPPPPRPPPPTPACINSRLRFDSTIKQVKSFCGLPNLKIPATGKIVGGKGPKCTMAKRSFYIARDKFKTNCRVAGTKKKEGFSNYSPGGAKDTYQPMGAFDGVKLPTGNKSSWRHTSPNEALAGNYPKFQVGPDNLFMFKDNQCKPSCCGASYACNGGCVCTTPDQRNFINMRGGNRTAPDAGV